MVIYPSLKFQQNGPIESEEVVDETDTETDAESSRKLGAGCQNCTVKEENEAGSEEVEEITEVLPQERKVRSLLTRSNIYRIFVDKLKRLVITYGIVTILS